MKILILTASPFFGGPERQMIELAKTLRIRHPDIECCLGSFPEKGNSREFLEKAAAEGFETLELIHDFPHLFKSSRELKRQSLARKIDIIIPNGHKPRCIALMVKRSLRIPVVTVSRGWTDEDFRIRFYNRMDRLFHRCCDHVIAVSEGQAKKVIRFGTPNNRVTIIQNAIRTERFGATPNPADRKTLETMFPEKTTFLLGAAGRFSPEKGYNLLIDAMKTIREKKFSAGLIIFGEGFLRESYQKQIAELGLQNFVRLPGFTNELDKFLPHFDLFLQSSYTEGLPNVLLESMAAQTPVVATAVGGTPEVVEDGVAGLLVSSGNAESIADAVCRLLTFPEKLSEMGRAGKLRVEQYFTFERQADAYYELLNRFCHKSIEI
ncbi:MAG: glycosyltransferase family 4 protein [Planctomycetaceae bacterium]|jgi:glycosyltransferase involved in cell wall biosynthesis|nr:glycosyltransferase family 4 protein [Planctomycetaceae bacterium]